MKTFKHKQIDQITHNGGHEGVRLPPYHCYLNPVELIWAKVDSEVKKNNSNNNQALKRVQEITKNSIERVTAEDWKNYVLHTRQIRG